MKDKKLERALYGPSIWEVTLGAVLAVALGAVAAVAYLVYKPVEVVKELPKEADRVAGQVYFIEGSKLSGKAGQWKAKRKRLADSTPGEIALIEDELNAWFAPEPTAAPKNAPKPPGTPPEAAPEQPVPDELVSVSSPSFRIFDGSLQVSCTATFNPLRLIELNTPVIVQADGGFEKRGDQFVYLPKTLMVGSLPVHRIPGATEYLVKRALQSKALPDEGLAAWKKVSAVTIEEKTLKLTVSPQ